MLTVLRRTAPARHRPLRLSRLLGLLSLRASRTRLATLDDRLLRDIGLTRDQARTEAERPLWDAPDHWLR